MRSSVATRTSRPSSLCASAGQACAIKTTARAACACLGKRAVLREHGRNAMTKVRRLRQLPARKPHRFVTVAVNAWNAGLRPIARHELAIPRAAVAGAAHIDLPSQPREPAVMVMEPKFAPAALTDRG
jgi:hypothetical protein